MSDNPSSPQSDNEGSGKSGVRPHGWRVGKKVPINVYAGDIPVCQCQTPEYARQIVEAVNAALDRASVQIREDCGDDAKAT